MENPYIRLAQLEDVDGIVSCIDQAYAQYVDKISDLPAVSRGCAEDIEDNHVWVIVEAHEIVACLSLIAQETTMKLANIAVLPQHNGKGLGRALISLAEREAKRQGYSEMRLNTHVQMPDNVRFYGRLGWQVVATIGHAVSMKKLL